MSDSADEPVELSVSTEDTEGAPEEELGRLLPMESALSDAIKSGKLDEAGLLASEQHLSALRFRISVLRGLVDGNS